MGRVMNLLQKIETFVPKSSKHMESKIAEYFARDGFNAQAEMYLEGLYTVTIFVGGENKYILEPFGISIIEKLVYYCPGSGREKIPLSQFVETVYMQILSFQFPTDYKFNTYSSRKNPVYAHNGTREYIKADRDNNESYGNIQPQDESPEPIFLEWYDAKIAEVTQAVRIALRALPIPISVEIIDYLPMQSVKV